MFFTFTSKRMDKFFARFDIDNYDFPPEWVLRRKVEASRRGRYVYIPELDTPIF